MLDFIRLLEAVAWSRYLTPIMQLFRNISATRELIILLYVQSIGANPNAGLQILANSLLLHCLLPDRRSNDTILSPRNPKPKHILSEHK